jgi:DNA-binding NarL/FixJ family response regulator
VGQQVRFLPVLLADGHPAFAEGLAMILEAESDLTVCGMAHDARRVVELAAAHRPSVLLLDTQLPGGDPAQTLAAVKAASPTTKVLLLSAATSSNAIAAATAAGAEGIVARGGSSRQLVDAIRRVADGRLAVVAAKPNPPPRGSSVELLRLWTLSDRELKVLGLLASGWSSRRIAQEWHLSLWTVHTHVQNLLVKLGVHSQLEAVVIAFRHGMAPVGERASRDRDSA